MMIVTAKYPFQGTLGLPQLSFPAGAQIKAKKIPNEGGWMYGSYNGQRGWFPESYVERQTPLPQIPEQKSTTRATTPPPQQQPQLQQQQRDSPPRSLSPHVTYSNVFAEQNDLPSSVSFSRDNAGSFDTQEEGFGMMGGTPGDLFEGAPKPTMYPQTEERPSSPTFLAQEEEDEEEAVDIYRHAPPRKRNYAEDYNPEISVQVTSKHPSTPPSLSRVRVAPGQSPTGASDFWKSHPGRVPGPSSADQAYELERAFHDLKDTDTIEIVEEKKKRFPYIPKSLKKAAKKTVSAVKRH